MSTPSFFCLLNTAILPPSVVRDWVRRSRSKEEGSVCLFAEKSPSTWASRVSSLSLRVGMRRRRRCKLKWRKVSRWLRMFRFIGGDPDLLSTGLAFFAQRYKRYPQNSFVSPHQVESYLQHIVECHIRDPLSGERGIPSRHLYPAIR